MGRLADDNLQAFLMSMVNPIPAQLRLLEAAKCDHLLVAADFPAFKPAVTAITSRRPLTVVDIANVDHWIAKDKVKEYPFTATLSENPQRPFVCIHTSGSTGESASREFNSNTVADRSFRPSRLDHLYLCGFVGVQVLQPSSRGGARCAYVKPRDVGK